MKASAKTDKRGLSDQSQPQDKQQAPMNVSGEPTRHAKSHDKAPPAQADVMQSALLDRAVARSGLSRDSFVRAIISTAFGRMVAWSQLDVERVLIAAERLGLDPALGEIFAVPRELPSDSVPGSACMANRPAELVLSVDGWCRVINSHPHFDGISFAESATSVDGMPEFIECTIYRKDRGTATSIREYMCEANTGTGAWVTHPRRMLRHKAMVQCARVCFGLGGVMELDEATRAHATRSAGVTGAAQVDTHFGSNRQGTQAIKSILSART